MGKITGFMEHTRQVPDRIQGGGLDLFQIAEAAGVPPGPRQKVSKRLVMVFRSEWARKPVFCQLLQHEEGICAGKITAYKQVAQVSCNTF